MRMTKTAFMTSTAKPKPFLHQSRFLTRLAASALALALLSGCMALDVKEVPKLSRAVVAEMSARGMKPESPVLVRIFKQESELEIWKMDKSGTYALFKTYPMCRWSGKLGPKKAAGDRQAPEGFYHVSAGMMNPNSQFFVSFNLGYPNRLESALGYTGEALMVHGACSSSGCYAMTDAAMGEIYAIAQKALDGGQQRFQVQAYPFRMTAANMARHRGDASMPFWRTLKEGYDLFAFTRRPPQVSTCGRRYVFNTEFTGGEPADPLAACPPGASTTPPEIAARMEAERTKVDAVLSAVEAPSLQPTAYMDGGMHPQFRTLLKQQGPVKMAAGISRTRYPVSRPEAALADPYAGLPR